MKQYSFHIGLLLTFISFSFFNFGCKDSSTALNGVEQLPPSLYGQVVDGQGNAIGDAGVHYIFDIPGTSLEGKLQPGPISLKTNKTCPSTTIRYTIPNQAKVTLIIFRWYTRDTIAVLVDDSLNAGTFSTTFDASKLTNGFYFYQLKVDSSVQEKMMVLLNTDISALINTNPLTKSNSSGSFELPYALLGFGVPVTRTSVDGQSIDTTEISSTIKIVLYKEGYSTLTQEVTVTSDAGIRQKFVLQKQ